MPSEEMITMTHEQLELEKRVAVHDKQLEILVDDYQKSMKSITGSISKFGDDINKLPKMISDCKEELEKDIMEAASNKYVTHDEIRGIKNKILGAVFMTGVFLGGLEIAIKLNII